MSTYLLRSKVAHFKKSASPFTWQILLETSENKLNYTKTIKRTHVYKNLQMKKFYKYSMIYQSLLHNIKKAEDDPNLQIFLKQETLTPRNFGTLFNIFLKWFPPTSISAMLTFSSASSTHFSTIDMNSWEKYKVKICKLFNIFHEMYKGYVFLSCKTYVYILRDTKRIIAAIKS